ncbi:hypothetical protein VTI28DRAFT_7536 [Corynascus sepedonium]
MRLAWRVAVQRAWDLVVPRGGVISETWLFLIVELGTARWVSWARVGERTEVGVCIDGVRNGVGEKWRDLGSTDPADFGGLNVGQARGSRPLGCGSVLGLGPWGRLSGRGGEGGGGSLGQEAGGGRYATIARSTVPKKWYKVALARLAWHARLEGK